MREQRPLEAGEDAGQVFGTAPGRPRRWAER